MACQPAVKSGDPPPSSGSRGNMTTGQSGAAEGAPRRTALARNCGRGTVRRPPRRPSSHGRHRRGRMDFTGAGDGQRPPESSLTPVRTHGGGGSGHRRVVDDLQVGFPPLTSAAVQTEYLAGSRPPDRRPARRFTARPPRGPLGGRVPWHPAVDLAAPCADLGAEGGGGGEGGPPPVPTSTAVRAGCDAWAAAPAGQLTDLGVPARSCRDTSLTARPRPLRLPRRCPYAPTHSG